MLTRNQRILKRFFDISISIVLLFFAIIPLVLLLILATIDLNRTGFFTQERIGQLGKPFALYKIRSLIGSNHEDIASIVKNETKFGRWLRSNKLDELPQIFNVLTGNMSLIGPRPDVAGYADRLEGDDRIILSVKPGITGPATIKYRNEDQLLLQQEDSKSFNDEVIWPDKIIINKNYIKNWSLRKDIGYLFASLVN
jgi:lipopolysaccharide/colanic/teichoic acid biosynthesis glycosyltransferase